MTHWNYRVLRREVGLVERESDLGIYEVYYGNDNIPHSCSASPMAPHGDDLTSLKNDLIWMANALRKPVLDFTSLEEGTVVMRQSQEKASNLPPLFTLEDVIKVAQAVRAASASLAFPSDVAYKRSIELGGGRVRQSIENLDVSSIVSSCFPQPQQQSESDTK